jgi:hypothetical protein
VERSAVVVASAIVAGVLGQPATRTASTVEALVAYPVFFQGRAITVRAEVTETEGYWRVTGGADKPVLVIWQDRGASPGRVELRGEFTDLGRLATEDPRLASVDPERLVMPFTGGRWPGRNEVFAIVGATADRAPPFAAPSLRAIALEPERYARQTVTVTGRFRGRNLYGDLPEPPDQSRWDFVLQSADGAVWITGMRPRGRGFDLDPEARVDTGRWLEVAGMVRHERPKVWIEATAIRQGTAAEEAPALPPPVPSLPPTPEVVFSTPLDGETEVPGDTAVRIQFSRDMDPKSFAGRVRASYVAPPGAGAPAVKTVYREGTRSVEIVFDPPLQRFSTVRVELLDGITALGGGSLAPWTLTFSVGG